MVGEIRQTHWTKDWVMTGQPIGQMDYEIGRRDSGEWFMLQLWAEHSVATASQVISQEFA